MNKNKLVDNIKTLYLKHTLETLENFFVDKSKVINHAQCEKLVVIWPKR